MNAKSYSEFNDAQKQYGKVLAHLAGMKRGDKILDMGCGTGELTSCLAEKVGKGSQIIGVDPDLDRIKVAIQKHSGVRENVTFKHGESSSQFPHFDEQYYDIHFSNFVFQWLNADEKKIFVKTAFSQEDEADIIKEAKQLFLNLDDEENVKMKVPVYYIKKSVTESLLQEAGFHILHSEYYQRDYIFPTAEEFLSFVCASDYYDQTRISTERKTDFFKKIVNMDGTVTCFDPNVYQIIAKK